MVGFILKFDLFNLSFFPSDRYGSVGKHVMNFSQRHKYPFFKKNWLGLVENQNTITPNVMRQYKVNVLK